MEIVIKLRRKWSGHDGYGTFIEEIGIDKQDNLFYRRSDGGNCEIGEIREWESEEKAFVFMLGFQPSKQLAELLKKELTLLPTLEEYADEYWDEEKGYTEAVGEINYGRY